MHFKPAVMTLYFVRKMERKTTNVPKMTVMDWKSGLELCIFIGDRLRAQLRHKTPGPAVSPAPLHRAANTEAIDGCAH